VPNRYDHLQTRCPRLGSVVNFHYCRTAAGEPCFKALDCWWQEFDVAGCFRQQLSEKEFERLTNARPPDKMTSLLDLIHRAQKQTRGSDDEK
jgi:hypothetical protein